LEVLNVQSFVLEATLPLSSMFAAIAVAQKMNSASSDPSAYINPLSKGTLSHSFPHLINIHFQKSNPFWRQEKRSQFFAFDFEYAGSLISLLNGEYALVNSTFQKGLQHVWKHE
jgi:hypothetical protein